MQFTLETVDFEGCMTSHKPTVSKAFCHITVNSTFHLVVRGKMLWMCFVDSVLPFFESGVSEPFLEAFLDVGFELVAAALALGIRGVGRV